MWRGSNTGDPRAGKRVVQMVNYKSILDKERREAKNELTHWRNKLKGSRNPNENEGEFSLRKGVTGWVIVRVWDTWVSDFGTRASLITFRCEGTLHGGIILIQQKINQQKQAKKGQYIMHKKHSQQRRENWQKRNSKKRKGKCNILEKVGLDPKSQRKRETVKDVKCKLREGGTVSVLLIRISPALKHREFVERMNKWHQFSEGF